MLNEIPTDVNIHIFDHYTHMNLDNSICNGEEFLSYITPLSHFMEFIFLP